MWKIDITFDKANTACVQNIITKLNKLDYDGFKVLVVHSALGIVLRINATNNIKPLRNYLQVLLAEEIVHIYKNQYFYKHVSIDKNSEFGRALLRALVMFEIENDYAYVFNKLDLEHNIVVPAFFEFKCGILTYKWQEFVNLTNANTQFLLDKEVYIEFVSFLLSSINSACMSVDVTYEDNCYLLLDQQNNVSERVQAGNEDALISRLIMLAPKQINVYCVDNISNSTFKLIYRIFNKKVNLLV